MDTPTNLFKKLAQVLPRGAKAHPPACHEGGLAGGLKLSNGRAEIQYQLERNPAFGWYAVELLSQEYERFPMVPEGKLNWIYKAWLWKSDPERYEGHPSFLPVIEAWDLDTNPDQRGSRAVLQAALIARDSTFETVASALSLGRPTVEAYDALFFNIKDRQDDDMYLRHVAYPNTRYEETLEGYLEKSTLDVLLLRIGYNRGLQAALQAAGLEENPGSGMTAAEVGEKFRHEVMITAYCLAAGGFLKFDKAHPIISMTISMIGAAKSRAKAAEDNGSQGGNERSFADVLKEQLSFGQSPATGQS